MNRYQRCYPTGSDDLRTRQGCHGNNDEPPMQSVDCNDLPLALAFVPPQPFQNLLLPEEGWHEGTIFADLIKPYEGGCRS